MFAILPNSGHTPGEYKSPFYQTKNTRVRSKEISTVIVTVVVRGNAATNCNYNIVLEAYSQYWNWFVGVRAK